MPNFSKRSLASFNTVHPKLQKILIEAIKRTDFCILEGHRDKETQDMYFKNGRSKLKWPNGEHNKMPSRAVDVCPFPIDFTNRDAFIALASVMKEEAERLGIKIRWGGDWDNDGDWKDERFSDMPHFELAKDEE